MMTVILVLGRMGRRQRRGHNLILISIPIRQRGLSNSGQCVAHKALSVSTHKKHQPARGFLHQIYEQTTN
jgi:hypothetical protein